MKATGLVGRLTLIALAAGIIFLLFACARAAAPPVQPTQTPTPTATVVPPTTTPTPLPTPSATPFPPTPTNTPSPSPTDTPTPSPAQPAAKPTPLTLPNLVPGWKFGQDGPIIISHEQGSAQDGPLTVDRIPFVDVVLHNQSLVPQTGEFLIDVYFDGQKVSAFHFAGRVPPVAFMREADWVGLPDTAQLTEGPHTLRIVIDPNNTFEEADETDNEFEKTFVWHAGEAAEPQPVAYTDDELRQALADLEALLDPSEPVVGPSGVDHSEQVLAAADAGYYLMTGKSFRDERVNIFLLKHNDYLTWIDAHYAQLFPVRKASQYEALAAARERFKQLPSFKTRRFGKVAIVVDAEGGVDQALTTLVHELGHMRQDFLNPEQTEDEQFYYLDSIQEAQARQFERAFWLTVEEFTGQSLIRYRDTARMRDQIDRKFDFWLESKDEDPHSLGQMLLWLAALEGPELAELRQQLVTDGRLDASSSLKLYEHLVNMEPEDVQAYVEGLLNALEKDAGLIREISKRRLVPDAADDADGPPALRVVGLMTP